MQTTLLASFVFAAVAAVMYSAVGAAIARRPVSTGNRLARNAFAVWWYGLAATSALGAIMLMVSFWRLHDLALYITFTMVALLLICLALWGLLAYLMFLVMGNTKALWPLTVAYTGFYLMLVYAILASNPYEVIRGDWGIEIQYENPLQGTAFSYVLGVLLLGPQIIAALGYFTLYFRVRDAALRKRILIVSLSIVLWFGTSLTASFAGASQSSSTWPWVSRSIGLVAAGAVYYAFTGLGPTQGDTDRPAGSGSAPLMPLPDETRRLAHGA